MKNWDHSIHQHVLVYQGKELELFCFIFVEVIKSLWVLFFFLLFFSWSPCTNPLVTVPRAPIIIGITVTFMFLCFFDSLARSRYLSFFSLYYHSLLLLLFSLSFTYLRVFHTSVRWWFFAGVWVTASLLKSPGLFSVSWPILMLLFGWSSLVRQLPSPPFLLVIL